MNKVILTNQARHLIAVLQNEQYGPAIKNIMRFNRLNRLVRHAFRRYQRRLVSLQAAKGGYVRESSFSQIQPRPQKYETSACRWHCWFRFSLPDFQKPMPSRSSLATIFTRSGNDRPNLSSRRSRNHKNQDRFFKTCGCLPVLKNGQPPAGIGQVRRCGCGSDYEQPTAGMVWSVPEIYHRQSLLHGVPSWLPSRLETPQCWR